MALPLTDLLSPDRTLLFRITHRDNVEFILKHGLHAQTSTVSDPSFVPIGHPEIIERRRARTVPVAPGGSLADYVPFYFTPCTPMLYNIVTGHNGVRMRPRAEIVVLVSSLDRLAAAGIACVIADRNAALTLAKYSKDNTSLTDLPWDDWRSRDFARNPDRPDKLDRYHAEVLAHRHVPIGAIGSIVTYDDATADQIKILVAQAACQVAVSRQQAWYPT